MDFRDFRRAGHMPTLFSAFLYFDISFMVWILPGALANSIVPEFGLSDSQKGLMVAVPLLGRRLAASGSRPAGRSHRGERTGILGMVPDDHSAPAGLAVGRPFRQASPGRPAAGRGRGQLRGRAAAGEPMVSAAVPGTGHGDRRGRQQRHRPGDLHRAPAGAGLGLARRLRPGPACRLLATLALFVVLCQGQPRTSRHRGRWRITPACCGCGTPGGSACSTRSRSAGLSAWRAF